MAKTNDSALINAKIMLSEIEAERKKIEKKIQALRLRQATFLNAVRPPTFNEKRRKVLMGWEPERMDEVYVEDALEGFHSLQEYAVELADLARVLFEDSGGAEFSESEALSRVSARRFDTLKNEANSLYEIVTDSLHMLEPPRVFPVEGIVRDSLDQIDQANDAIYRTVKDIQWWLKHG